MLVNRGSLTAVILTVLMGGLLIWGVAAAEASGPDVDDIMEELQEEADPQAMLGELKKVSDDYYKNLQKILSTEQWEQYQALREQILSR